MNDLFGTITVSRFPQFGPYHVQLIGCRYWYHPNSIIVQHHMKQVSLDLVKIPYTQFTQENEKGTLCLMYVIHIAIQGEEKKYKHFFQEDIQTKDQDQSSMEAKS